MCAFRVQTDQCRAQTPGPLLAPPAQGHPPAAPTTQGRDPPPLASFTLTSPRAAHLPCLLLPQKPHPPTCWLTQVLPRVALRHGGLSSWELCMRNCLPNDNCPLTCWSCHSYSFLLTHYILKQKGSGPGAIRVHGDELALSPVQLDL